MGGASGRLRGVFGRLGASWAPLGRVLGASCGVLVRLGGVLGASWRLFGASWGRLGGVLGRLGSVLGPCWAVLRASWVRLGASENPGMLKSEKPKYYSDSENRALNTILVPKTGRPVFEFRI